MKPHGHRRERTTGHGGGALMRPALMSAALFAVAVPALHAQTTAAPSVPQQIQQLTDAMARAQAQIQESQRQLDEMRLQMKRLQDQMAVQQAATGTNVPAPASVPPAATAAEMEDVRERQAMQEAQIATQDQTKVESESKYPVKITGLLLLNGFVNTNAVDDPATPTLAIPGAGSTGATVRQTILGLEASGPHLFGARSYADLHVDFDGTQQATATPVGYTGYNINSTFLRLRTAHAGLQWQHTNAYFALDRPIISPDSPTSLAAVAEPALAWSGNLWTWNPQLGLTHDIEAGGSRAIRLQAALIDTGAPPTSTFTPAVPTSGAVPPTPAERSRWPGVEARIALLGSTVREDANHIGIGGYFSPHTPPVGYSYDSWAGTLDTHLNLPAHLSLSTYFYRGLALGGLGGGAYKDYAYRTDPDPGVFYFRPLDGIGGWAQLKEKPTTRLEFNAAFGLDGVIARELRPFSVSGGNIYQNLARNRSYTGNVIFSPSTYLLFSVEYRRLASSPVKGSASGSNVLGVAAAYKF